MEKVKQFFLAAGGVLAMILGAVFYSQRKRLQKVEGELAHSVNSIDTIKNDKDVEAAKGRSQSAEEAYKKLLEHYKRGDL